MPNKQTSETEPPLEVVESFQKQIQNELGIKLPKKEVVFVLKKSEEAHEAGDLMDKALKSRPSLSGKSLDEFREIYESIPKSGKKLSDFEANEAAKGLSVMAMMQRHRQAGEAIRATLIKHKKIELTSADKDKLKRLFMLAFDLELSDTAVEYYLKLSHWFAWYKEGLEYSLSKALDNLLIHYDKKKRGKKGSLKTDDYDIGYFYRWIAYYKKEGLKNTRQGSKEFTLNSFIKWVDKDYHSVRSFLAGDECTINKDGSYTMKVSLKDWE